MVLFMSRRYKGFRPSKFIIGYAARLFFRYKLHCVSLLKIRLDTV